tara:strand:+ start:3265 stop:3822 length:558 start_codon:yes stop_codon:yes gene_type:complete
MSVIIPLTDINPNHTKDIELEPELALFVKSSQWPQEIQALFFDFLYSNVEHASKLNLLFSNTDFLHQCIPLIAYSELIESFIIIYSDQTQEPPEPGEPGSVLSYFRSYGYGENVLCSDCYGQLSCSSCSVEVHNGIPENKEPRDEEYDMLDIDNEKPATEFSRLSCQTLVGKTPLILTIRKPINS